VYIEVNDNDRFGIGSELWLYIATGNMARQNDLQIESARISFINDRYPHNDSGLRMDQTRRLHHPRGNFWLDGIAYTVTRQPYADSNPVIRIENIVVSGQVFPDTNYYLVVSGTQIAQNDQEVRAARLPGDVGAFPWYLGGHLREGHVGTFTSLPFNQVIVGHGEGGLGEVAAPGGAGGPVTFHVGMPVDGILPLVFHQFSPDFATALLSARVFAYHYGLDYYWDDAARSFTFSGYSRTGEYVTVVLTLGASSAQINGEAFDIASAVGQPQLVGMIQPYVVDGRQYVPARFLANAFGIPILDVVVGSSLTLG
jgi:hypothetical protein